MAYKENLGNGKILKYIWPVPRNTIMMYDIRTYIIADFTFPVEIKRKIEKMKGVREVTICAGSLTVEKNEDVKWDVLHSEIVKIVQEC